MEHDYSSISEGTQASQTYRIDTPQFTALTEAFGDKNPLHVDDEYARGAGFERKVMHGAILQGFLSHFVGMVFPGTLSTLLSVDLRYANPSYSGDAVELNAKVTQKLETHRILVIDVEFKNLTRERIAARGRIQVQMRKAVGTA